MLFSTRVTSVVMLCAIAAGCGGTDEERAERASEQRQISLADRQRKGDSFFSLFRSTNEDQRIAVNKYLWTASLDTLSFLPLEAADPFSGVITTGWGRINGSSTPYRVTVYITEPALEARSLRVAVFRQAGRGAVAVSDEVARQVEDAILTRARQIRVAEAGRNS